MKKKIAIVGSGISGMTLAHQLKDKFDVELFEKVPGIETLIKCEVLDGFLSHIDGVIKY